MSLRVEFLEKIITTTKSYLRLDYRGDIRQCQKKNVSYRHHCRVILQHTTQVDEKTENDNYDMTFSVPL